MCSTRRRSGRSRCSVPMAWSTSWCADEAARRYGREAVPLVLPGPDRRVGVRRPATSCRDVIPEDRLRGYDVRTAIDVLFDTGSRARAPARLRHRNDHRARAHRGAPGRRHRQQPRPSRRRDRQRRRRQGGAVHAALRRVRHPDRLPVRHARDDGRARCRADGARAALLSAVRDRRQRRRSRS